MQRGFKSQCEQISKRYRKELGLTLDEALPYRTFADHLKVRIWTPEQVPDLEQSFVDLLTNESASYWSAVTVQSDGKTRIIVNSSHSEKRLANDVTHELAHLILDHKKARLEISDDGLLWLKSYRKEQEEEADWLAAALLLPREGLMSVYRKTTDIVNLSNIFEVSTDLVNMRINRTGITKQLSYSKKGVSL